MKIFGKEIKITYEISRELITNLIILFTILYYIFFYQRPNPPYVEISLIDIQTLRYDLTSKDIELGISYMSNNFDENKLELPLKIEISTLNPTQKEYITISKIKKKEYLKAFEYTILDLETDIELNKDTMLVVKINSELDINSTFLKFIKPEYYNNKNQIMLYKNH